LHNYVGLVDDNSWGETQTFFAQAGDATGNSVPQFLKNEFDALLSCGIVSHCLLRLLLADWANGRHLRFSCKRKVVCPSCGALRTVRPAAHLVEQVNSWVPARQRMGRCRSIAGDARTHPCFA